MSVRLRLARGGTKKRPVYRIVATDSRSPRDGRFLEKLGTYNPLLPSDHPSRIVLREERIRHWLATGAKPSDRVARFLDGAGITSDTAKHRGTGKQPPASNVIGRAGMSAGVGVAVSGAASGAVPTPGPVSSLCSVAVRFSGGRENDATRAAMPRTMAKRRSARLMCTVLILDRWTFGLGTGNAGVKVHARQVDLGAEARATV